MKYRDGYGFVLDSEEEIDIDYDDEPRKVRLPCYIRT
jgi:hypothetical protein